MPSRAAISRTDVSLMSGNTAGWVETVSTNVLGTAMVTREALQASLDGWVGVDCVVGC